MRERIDIMDFIEKFKKIKKKFDKIESSKIGENLAVQVNMTDEDCGGTFYISNIDGVFSVEPYDYHDYTAMITSSAADFEKLIGRKTEPGKAVESGKISVVGNMEHIKTLVSLFPESAPKVPAKKTSAPKKAAASKKSASSKKTSAAKKPAAKPAGAKKSSASAVNADDNEK